jgi:hypothetical protein
MMNMIRSTSMTSTSGVVLMSDIGVSSPSLEPPTFIAMSSVSYSGIHRREGG